MPHNLPNGKRSLESRLCHLSLRTASLQFRHLHQFRPPDQRANFPRRASLLIATPLYRRACPPLAGGRFFTPAKFSPPRGRKVFQ